jgi:hypothetical protein
MVDTEKIILISASSIYVLFACLLLFIRPIRMYLLRRKFNRTVAHLIGDQSGLYNPDDETDEKFKEYIEFCLRLNAFKSSYIPTFDVYSEWIAIHQQFEKKVIELKKIYKKFYSYWW